MTDLITLPRAVVEQALHVATAAGYPVALIAALKAALEQPEQEPHWLTKELMADYLDMVAEAIEENRSEMLRHKAHWMRKRGEV
jgi:hypothetical protein